MCTTYRFSIAQLNDIPDIVRLVNSAYRGDSSRKGWTTEADYLDGIRVDELSVGSMIKNPCAIILTCHTVQGDLIGCVYLENQKEGKLYLGMLTVSPELQAKGIGKLLLQESEKYAIKQHCSSIVMTVITIREELIAWYERRGFRKTEIIQPFPNNPRFGIPKQPLEFVLMEKRLEKE